MKYLLKYKKKMLIKIPNFIEKNLSILQEFHVLHYYETYTNSNNAYTQMAHVKL